MDDLRAAYPRAGVFFLFLAFRACSHRSTSLLISRPRSDSCDIPKLSIAKTQAPTWLIDGNPKNSDQAVALMETPYIMVAN